MTAPLVSVLIDTYNQERFIEEALVSVLEQDFPRRDMEIVVVDDGSTDRTPEIVRKFEPDVRLLRKTNGGQASAFNAGIPKTRGEVVAFLDGDDWWAKNKLRRVIELMSDDSSLGIVGHGISIVQPDGSEQVETLRNGFRFSANTIHGARLFRVRRSFLGASRMAIRAELLRLIGSIPEAIVIEADEYLFTLASVLSLAQILPEALTYYRLHDANLYQMSQADEGRAKRKYAALKSLSQSLSLELEARRTPSQVRNLLIDAVRAEADQLRLSLGDGWPWETVRTEWLMYRMNHPDSAASHRVFKALSLFPALMVPPGTFYRIRGRIARNDLYLRARKRWLPMPQMTHIARASKSSR
jgi:glycosyltransferase involved in cell wall biosynthesis